MSFFYTRNLKVKNKRRKTRKAQNIMEEVIVDNIQGSVERFEDTCEPGQAPITHYIISIKFFHAPSPFYI